jgi:hypothetical protein
MSVASRATELFEGFESRARARASRFGAFEPASESENARVFLIFALRLIANRADHANWLPAANSNSVRKTYFLLSPIAPLSRFRAEGDRKEQAIIGASWF